MLSIAHSELLLALIRRDWETAEELHARKPVDASFAEACAECDVHPQIHTLLEEHGRLHLAGGRLERAMRIVTAGLVAYPGTTTAAG